LAGVGLVALTAPAFAQQATGLYVSAGVGANWLHSDHEFDAEGDAYFEQPPFTPFGSVSASGSGDIDFDTGWIGVAAIGYDWGMFRGEAELGIRTNDFGDVDGR